MKASFIFIALLSVSVQCTIVEVSNGKLLGSFNGKYYSFTNIPYGQPPIGEKRCEDPLPYTDNWAGLRNATGPSVACVKFSRSESPSNGVENCLTLNVFTPDISPGRSRLPVRVFIYGGGFMIGAAGDTAEQFVVGQGIVLAIMNYRVGALGFLSSGDELISGNYGLKDQQLALKYIYENIHAFGGDRDKILLGGVSAGGSSTNLHLLNQRSCRFFSAGASSSGTALNPWVMQDDPKSQFRKFIRLVGCDDSQSSREIKLCLQARTKEEIFIATNALKSNFTDNPFNVFGVVVEKTSVRNAFITEHPRTLMQKGLICNKPWIAAHTQREGTYTAAEFLSLGDNGRPLIEILNTRWREIAPIVLFFNNSCVGCSEREANRFRNDYSDYLRRTYMQGKIFSVETYPLLEKMFNDVLFVNGVNEAIDLHRKFGKAPVYAFVYENPLNLTIGNILSNLFDVSFGADHGADMYCLLPLKFLIQPGKGCTGNSKFISEALIEMGRELSCTGVAEYDCRQLPINNATHTGVLRIYETFYTIESESKYGGYKIKTYENNSCRKPGRK